MSENAFRACWHTLLRMIEEQRPLSIYFSALGIHPNFDLYVSESWQQHYSVIFHFTLLTALVTVSRCNATVVLYYTCDRTRQTSFSLLFFNFCFAMLALQKVVLYGNSIDIAGQDSLMVSTRVRLNLDLGSVLENLNLINLHSSDSSCVFTLLELHHFPFMF